MATKTTSLVSHDSYYESNISNEPRQKLFAVLRFEKHGNTDEPGWIFQIITQDQTALLKSMKQSIDFPNTDGQGYTTNKKDVILVELIPTDTYIQKI